MVRAQSRGRMRTARSGDRQISGAHWAADNGRFTTLRWDEGVWWEWLSRECTTHPECAFATAPDYLELTGDGPVGDPARTLVESLPWLPRIRGLGVPAGFVLQDGVTSGMVPWDDLDVVFIGGGNGFKEAHSTHQLVLEAQDRGKQVHMGRVNTRRRLRIAGQWGCDSVDGTTLAFSPDRTLPSLLRWLDPDQGSFFGIE